MATLDLLIEATMPNSQESNYQEWEGLVLRAGYIFAYADGLNRFYVAKEHEDLLPAFEYPPNVFDEYVLSSHHQALRRAQDAEARRQEAEALLGAARARQVQVEAQILHAQEQAAATEAWATEAEERAVDAKHRADALQT